jgi:hypothetical protein
MADFEQWIVDLVRRQRFVPSSRHPPSPPQHMWYWLVTDWLGGYFITILLGWVGLEFFHHFWSLRVLSGIDSLYARATMTREIDIVESASIAEFQQYWEHCHEDQRNRVGDFALNAGRPFELMVESSTQHPTRDLSHSASCWGAMPITLLFRTFNSVRIWRTTESLRKLGFELFELPHVHLLHYKSDDSPRRPLLVVYPQFSGDFYVVSIFSELKDRFDILFVCPLGIQCSWSQRPARHTDSLEEYLPFVLQYDAIIPITWSAGNVPFQLLDRYLELKGERGRIQTVVRLDPVGHPTSNFVVYTGVPLPWHKLWLQFLRLGSRTDGAAGFWDHFGCIGLSYLLKTPHGYSYLKSTRFLRGSTKFCLPPYHEHHFTATFDPLWNIQHPFFELDKKLLCNEEHVTTYEMEGFHGLWLSHQTIRDKVFPVVAKYA